MKRQVSPRWVRAAVAALVAVASLCLAGCGSSGTANGKKVIKVAYSSNWVFYSTPEAAQYWTGLAKAFDKKYPDATVQLVPIPGGYNDIVAKLDLLYRSASTAPDVAQLPGPGQLGQDVSSGFIRPLDSYVATAPWWSAFTPSFKKEVTLNGHVYAVEQGENNGGIYYNKAIFQKAGIPLPWQPTSWADIISAAEKVHAAEPSVWPVWLQAGSAGGTADFSYSAAPFLYGSSSPVIYDTNTKKWVVDSPGLRQVFNFYLDLSRHDLQAPASELENPNALNNITVLIQEGKIAISFGNNSPGWAWTHTTCAPCWPQAPKVMGAAYIPTMTGQAPGRVSIQAGTELVMSATTPHPSLAWDFINLAQQRNSMMQIDQGDGQIVPDTTLWSQPAYTDFAPPFVNFYTQLSRGDAILPELNDFTIWTQGFNQATGAIIQSGVSPSQAVAMLKSYVTNQLGASNVETIG